MLPFVAYNYMLEELEWDIVLAGNVILVLYVGLATVLWTARCAYRRVDHRSGGTPSMLPLASAPQLCLPRCQQGHDLRPAGRAAKAHVDRAP